jgi:hypothetical protein
MAEVCTKLFIYKLISLLEYNYFRYVDAHVFFAKHFNVNHSKSFVVAELLTAINKHCANYYK